MKLSEVTNSILKSSDFHLLPSDKYTKISNLFDLVTSSTYEEANKFLAIIDSFLRAELLYKMYYLLSDKLEWLKLFGEYWTSCDSCSLYSKEYNKILKSFDIDVIKQTIYTDSDLKFHNSLPDLITVYRGTFLDPRFIDGISWTTDKSVADRFYQGYNNVSSGLMGLRYKFNLPESKFLEFLDIAKQGCDVISIIVPKHDIFVVTARSEDEIIVL